MKFVVATDGSGASDRALDHAVDLARAADWSLTLVHAVTPNVYDVGSVAKGLVETSSLPVTVVR